MSDETSNTTDSEQATPKQRSTPAIWLATVGGVGWIPFAPGTWGSAAGVPLAWLVMQIPDWLGMPAPAIQAVVMAAIFLVGIPICTIAANQMGLGKDPGQIVYDEFAVMPVVFFLVPLGNPWLWLAGFGLFRVFDILKPPPIKRLEKFGDGLGVMIDDLMAAVYANVALQLLVRFGPLAPG